ncbi:unnamed protein product [Aphanomyces euteiches]
MKSVRLDSDAPPSVPEDKELDVLDATGNIPLSLDSPPKPSHAIDLEDGIMETIQTGNPEDEIVQARDPTQVASAVITQNNRKMRTTRRPTQNALIAISTLASDGPIEGSINTLPLEIQVAFRVKVLGLFTLHLAALSLLVIIFTYSPLCTDSLREFADDDTGVALGGSSCLALIVLFLLYLVKFFFPFNFVLLCFFTSIQAVAVTAFGLYFDTKASVLACLVCFFVMLFMTFFSTRRRNHELVHSAIAALFAYSIVTLVACIIFAAHGTGLMSSTTFGIVMLFTFAVIMWFAFDAHCMYQIMTPDEYMSGVIFFYTDLAFFLIFVGVMMLCIAACDGGAPVTCFGGGLGVTMDPNDESSIPQPESAVDSPSSAPHLPEATA